MKSEEFIITASKIVGFSKAGSRSATSRAYYGAFHFAIEVVCELADIGIERFSHNHSLPGNCLSKANDDNARQAANLLGNLQSRRIAADYKINQSNPESLKYGQYSVLQAQKCQQFLENLRAKFHADSSAKHEFAAKVKELLKIYSGQKDVG